MQNINIHIVNLNEFLDVIELLRIMKIWFRLGDFLKAQLMMLKSNIISLRLVVV